MKTYIKANKLKIAMTILYAVPPLFILGLTILLWWFIEKTDPIITKIVIGLEALG